MTGFFFFQAEDGIRDLVRSRGLGDVYKRQVNLQPLFELRKRQKSIRCGHSRVTWTRGQEAVGHPRTLSLIHI
mgnify:CR=1 FL=1